MYRFVAVLTTFLLFSSSIKANASNELWAYQEVTFKSVDAALRGTLVLPSNQVIKAAAIFVHGSGKQTRWIAFAERMAQNGIAILVYDKRGVGESGGKYEGKNPVSETNIRLLADDAISAFNYLAKRPELKGIPLGMTGLSQAGWIVPVAAQKALELVPNDNTNNIGVPAFIVLWSGPVTKVSEEDIFSKYTADKDKQRIPSYQEALDSRLLPYRWPAFLGEDLDPSNSLKGMQLPGLWVFGKQDGSIPVDLSIERLELLMETSPAFEYVLFSGQGHNNVGASLNMVTDWIKHLGIDKKNKR